jgi:hypothetical protein
MWERLGGNLRIDAAKLMAAGWQPLHDTRGGLTAMVETLQHEPKAEAGFPKRSCSTKNLADK